MMLPADSSNIGDLARTILGKRFDVVKLDIPFILNRVVIDKAIKESISALLRQNLLFLAFRNLSLKGCHYPRPPLQRYSITTQFGLPVK